MKKTLGTFKPTEEIGFEQGLDSQQKALVEEVYRRLQVFTHGCQEIHDRAKVARKIILLQDPYQDAISYDAEGNPVYANAAGKPTMQLQTLKSTFNNNVADQMDNMPEAVMIPERMDGDKQAEELTDAVRWILDHNDYESIHRRRVEDYIGTGTSVLQVTWDRDMDYGKGNIAIIRYPIEGILFDPLAETLQDSRAIMKVSWHPLSWYTAHYPEQAHFIGGETAMYENVGVLLAQEENEDEDEPRAMLIEYWYRLYDAKTRRYTINVALIAGGALLEVKEDVYWHGRYPFVADVYTSIEGMWAGEGMVMELAPMMRYINRYVSYIDMNLRMSSKGRLLVRKGSNIKKEELADWSVDIIEGDNITREDVQWLQSVPFTGAVTQMVLQLQTDMKMDSGQSQFTRGETAGGVTAFSAINALRESGSKQSRVRTASLNAGYKEMCEQIMWLMYQFYGKDRKLLITGSTGARKEIDASSEHLFGSTKGRGKGAYPSPQYTVRVQVHRRNPAQIQAQNELFIQAYTMAAQAQQVFPLSALFELLTVDGKERILPILRQNDAIQQQMQQLAQQNAQLMEQNRALQQGVRELEQVNAQMTKKLRGERPQGAPTQPAPTAQPAAQPQPERV